MIKTQNQELDAVIATLSAQRNDALDAAAVLAGRLQTQELLTKELEKKLDEATKGKE